MAAVRVSGCNVVKGCGGRLFGRKHGRREASALPHLPHQVWKQYAVKAVRVAASSLAAVSGQSCEGCCMMSGSSTFEAVKVTASSLAAVHGQSREGCRIKFGSSKWPMP